MKWNMKDRDRLIDSSLPWATACFQGHCSNTGERKLKNRKFFVGVIGLNGRFSVQAEQRKKPVSVGPLPGDRNTLSRFVA